MNTKKRNNLRKDERAVSPVIGVILMVAITVIMAAVIGAFVYGYTGSMTQMKDVSATARHQNVSIYVTYMGGPDEGLVDSMNYKVNGAGGDLGIVVGTCEEVTANVDPGQGNHIVVVANFSDGTSQVVLDSFC